MIKTYFYLLLILLTSISAYSQNQEYSIVKGVVINADSVVIPFAYVALKHDGAQSSAKADENGNFLFEYLSDGEYLLFADNYGKDSTIYRKVNVTNNEVIDLKSVILFEKGDTLVTPYPPPQILKD